MSRTQSWSEWIASGAWAESNDAVLPMLPSLADDVMSMAMDPDVGVAKLVRIVAKDQSLATNVLRLANSAQNAAMAEITTVNEAIIRLGTGPVKKVVLAVCFTSRLQGSAVSGAQGRALRDHAIGTAYLARLVAERTGVDPDEAFMYGLLHDLGKLALLKLASDRAKAGAPAPSAEEADQVCRERHAEVGARLLAQWQLATLETPVRYHHEPHLATSRASEAAVAYVANRLSHRYGFGCDLDEGPLLDDPVCAGVGLDEARLADLDKRAPGLFEVARQIGN